MDKKISLALSGGGSRAIAFHMGCFRSLRKHDLLNDIQTISSVSGGSVFAAVYFKYGDDFDVFEEKIIKILQKGLVLPSLQTIFSRWGILWIASEFLVLMLSITELVVSSILKFIRLLSKIFGIELWKDNSFKWGVRRYFSRTSILEKTLDYLLFDNETLPSWKRPGQVLILNATELTTGSAFRFSTNISGGWRFGKLKDQNVKVSHAVAASAAYPVFLTQLQDHHIFIRKDNTSLESKISLTDGGIYDNLGLGPLWPDRSEDVSYNVFPSKIIICCSAGYGLRADNHPLYWIGRMKQSFYTTFDRAQNAAIDKVTKLKENNEIDVLIFPYLGMQDENLPDKPSNLVPREEVHKYPTDFFAMKEDKIKRISLRGEQLCDHLIKLYGEKLTKT